MMEQEPTLTSQRIKEIVETVEGAQVLEGTADKLGVLVTSKNGSTREVIFDFSETAAPPQAEEK